MNTMIVIKMGGTSMANLWERIFRSGKSNSKNVEAYKQSSADAGEITRLDDYDVFKVIAKLRDTNNNYKDCYLEYASMAEDEVIGSALELYSDDATQIDTDTSRRVTVLTDSGNKRLRDDIVAFLDSIGTEDRLWTWAYQVAMMGDLFTRVVRDKEGRIIYLEDVDFPGEILDLHFRGVRTNFAREVPQEERTTKISSRQVEYEFYPADAFVHFMTRSTRASDEFYVEVNQDEVRDEPDIRKYKVIRGESMLERARAIWRILRLLEDSLLAARIAKAEYFRIYNIEVGETTSPKDARKTVREVKNLFDSKPSMDVRKGTYQSVKQLRPIGDPVFNPVRGGKGAISKEEVGGEFEVKSLVDIDYFRNKLFSALKTPKAYLGFEEALPSGYGDTTLMQQDMRYARTVKRVSRALISGITDIVNLWLTSVGRSKDIGKFTIELVSPSSSEELMRLKELETRLDTVDKVLATCREFSEVIDYPGLTREVLQLLSNYTELDEIVAKYLNDATEKIVLPEEKLSTDLYGGSMSNQMMEDEQELAMMNPDDILPTDVE